MTPTERVKAKMALQLSKLPTKSASSGESAENNTPGARGWERFSFDKEAPVDNDTEETLDETDREIQEAQRKIQPLLSRIDQSHEDAIFGPVTIPCSISTGLPSPKFDSSQNPPSPKRLRKTKEPETEDPNELASSKVAVQQRNLQNEWLRRKEAMRNALSGNPQAVSEPPPPRKPAPVKHAPISFQLNYKN